MRINEETHTHITSRSPRTSEIETVSDLGWKLRHVVYVNDSISCTQKHEKGFRLPSILFSFVGGKKKRKNLR